MKLTLYATNLLLRYIILQDLLGARPFRLFDSKGGEMRIKARHVPNKEGEMFPRRKSIFQKEKMPTGSSKHMREE